MLGVGGQGWGIGGERLQGFSYERDGKFVGILKNNLLLGHNSSSLPSPKKYFYPVYHLNVARFPAVRSFPFCFVFYTLSPQTQYTNIAICLVTNLFSRLRIG